MTKKEAREIIKKFKKLKFKCIAPNEVVEALKVLDYTSLAQQTKLARSKRKIGGATPS